MPPRKKKVNNNNIENTFHDKQVVKICIHPKTDGQKDYWSLMDSSRLVICDGPSGCGKTTLAIAKATEYLLNNKIEQVIISRPCIDASPRGLGFLPGDLKEKVAPYMIPMMEEIEKAIHVNREEGRMAARKLFETGKIKIEPLEFLRGRNFHNTFMILDEANNCTFEQLVMFATRMGYNSKCVISGDYKQTDLTYRDGRKYEDFDRFIERMENVEYEEDKDISVCSMSINDVVRDPIITKILSRCGMN